MRLAARITAGGFFRGQGPRSAGSAIDRTPQSPDKPIGSQPRSSVCVIAAIAALTGARLRQELMFCALLEPAVNSTGSVVEERRCSKLTPAGSHYLRRRYY